MVQSDAKPQLPKIKNKNEIDFEVFVDEELANQYVLGAMIITLC